MTMPYRAALDHLASLTIPGLRHNYAIDKLPPRLERAELPALILLPLELQPERLFSDRGGFQRISFGGQARQFSTTLTHLMLIAPAQGGPGLRAQLPLLVDCIDAYAAVLGADLTLGGRLAEAARIQVEPGLYEFGGQQYIGCAFRHTWQIAI